MARPNDKFAEDLKKAPSGVKPLDTARMDAEEHLRDLPLTKGEREKGASPAYAKGKKIARKER